MFIKKSKREGFASAASEHKGMITGALTPSWHELIENCTFNGEIRVFEIGKEENIGFTNISGCIPFC
jgi:hypothetical protein